MAFGIKHLPHKLYKNSFLRFVVLEFSYNPVVVDNTSKISIREAFDKYLEKYFQTSFPDAKFPEEAISIFSSKKDLAFEFGLDNTKLLVAPEKYNSFLDDVVPHILKIKQMLRSVLNIDCVSSIAIRKINVWSVGLDPENNVGLADYERAFFSNKLMESVVVENDAESDTTTKVCRLEDGKYLADVRIVEDKVDDSKTMFLRLDYKVESKAKVPCDNLEEMTLELNDVAFDVFNWAISDVILKVLDN